MLFKLPSGDRIQVEHIERVTAPRRMQGGNGWTFQICFASGSSVHVDADQDTVEERHKALIGAMGERA